MHDSNLFQDRSGKIALGLHVANRGAKQASAANPPMATLGLKVYLATSCPSSTFSPSPPLSRSTRR
jgi:hypothetical protein